MRPGASAVITSTCCLSTWCLWTCCPCSCLGERGRCSEGKGKRDGGHRQKQTRTEDHPGSPLGYDGIDPITPNSNWLAERLHAGKGILQRPSAERPRRSDDDRHRNGVHGKVDRRGVERMEEIQQRRSKAAVTAFLAHVRFGSVNGHRHPVQARVCLGAVLACLGVYEYAP
jgi:hypothetical protein